MHRPLLVSVLTLLLAHEAASQETFTVNGATAATLPPGGILVAAATLPPGTAAVIAYDESPGPIPFGDDLIPLGLTPALGPVGSVGIVPESGVFVVTATVPDSAALIGLDFYLCGIALDPSDSNGIVFTTGASLAIRVASSAGADRAVFTGESILLDGGANASAGGALAAGDTLAWQIVSAPLGSTAALTGGTTLYPTLTPDLPGDYIVQAVLSKNGSPLAPDLTTVTALGLQALTVTDGAVEPGGDLDIGGILSPASSIASAKFCGSPLPIALDGSFLVPDFGWSLEDVSLPLEIEVTTTSGQVLVQNWTVFHGSPEPVLGPINSAMDLQLSLQCFIDFCTVVKAGLSPATFSSVVNIAPITYDAGVLGIPVGSLTVDPTGGTYSNLTVAPTMMGDHVLVTSTMTGAKVNFNYSGSILFVPFSSSGSATANVVVKNRVKFVTPAGGAQDGQILVQITTESVSITNISLNLGGIPSLITNIASSLVNTLFSGIIQNQVKNLVQQAVGGVMDTLKVLTTKFTETLEKVYEQTLKYFGAAYTAVGVAFQSVVDMVPVLPPTGPPIGVCPKEGAAVPPFGPTVPGTGESYHWASASKTDSLNVILAKLTAGGFVNGDFDAFATQLSQAFGNVPFTAAELAAWLPTAGFERLPAAQLVKVVLVPTVAPVVKANPTEAKLKTEFDGVKAKFITKAPGTDIDIEYLKVNLGAKSTFKVDKASNKKLEMSLESKAEKANPVKGMPGLKKEAAQAGFEKFSEILTPLLQRALAKLAIPGYAGAGGFPFSQQKQAAPLGAAVASWSKFSATP